MRPRLPLALAPPLAAVLPHSHHLRRRLSNASPPKPPPPPLSPADLAAISALLPRLLAAGHVPAAGRLLSAALLLPGSADALPFPLLASRLASLPSLSPAFALLSSLHHHPLRPSPLPLATPLLSHLLRRRRARDAAAVLRWLCRPASAHRPDAATYAATIRGFCQLEDARSALISLKEMALDGIGASQELREAVRDALLQDARIEAAWALDAAIDTGKAAEAIDGMLREWED